MVPLVWKFVLVCIVASYELCYLVLTLFTSNLVPLEIDTNKMSLLCSSKELLFFQTIIVVNVSVAIVVIVTIVCLR